MRFATADLSNFYLDVAKDRLYISAVNNSRRRSCQTVIHALLEGLAKSVTPNLPHMAEDIWQNLPYKAEGDDSSVFEGGISEELVSYPEFDAARWNLVRDVRIDVNQVLEVARQDKLVGASLDAAAYIHTYLQRKRPKGPGGTGRRREPDLPQYQDKRCRRAPHDPYDVAGEDRGL